MNKETADKKVPMVCIDCVNLTNNGKGEYYCGIKHTIPSNCVIDIPDWSYENKQEKVNNG